MQKLELFSGTMGFSDLKNLKEGIHNTMSVGVDEETGKLYVSIW